MSAGPTIRVVLTDGAWIAMNHAAAHDRARCTDVVSRALVLYSLIETGEPGDGFSFQMRDGERVVRIET
jgi:hypothetical protein